jgi:hypothetical protein
MKVQNPLKAIYDIKVIKDELKQFGGRCALIKTTLKYIRTY